MLSVGLTDGKSHLGNQFDVIDAVWNEIGQIESIVFSKYGQMGSSLGDVGGFREIGGKHLMISVPVVAVPAL